MTWKCHGSSCIHSTSPKCQELLGNRHRGELQCKNGGISKAEKPTSLYAVMTLICRIWKTNKKKKHKVAADRWGSFTQNAKRLFQLLRANEKWMNEWYLGFFPIRLWLHGGGCFGSVLRAFMNSSWVLNISTKPKFFEHDAFKQRWSEAIALPIASVGIEVPSHLKCFNNRVITWTIKNSFTGQTLI